MNMKIVAFIGLLFVLVISGCVSETVTVTEGTGSESEIIKETPPEVEVVTPPTPVEQPAEVEAEGPQTIEVSITATGFSPKTVTIKQGDTVRWTNTTFMGSSPASNTHPSHTGYPQGGGCRGSTFDSCGAVRNGESYSFTFNKIGTWGYHDHARPTNTGTIIVE